MINYDEKVEEVIIVTKEGCRTRMPNVWMAKSYAEGTWKGKVDRIEVKSVIKVNEENPSEKETLKRKKIKVTKDNIHDLIDSWHESDSTLELHEFLGLTFEQYAHWVKTDELPDM